jgi:hypothetical protein
LGWKTSAILGGTGLAALTAVFAWQQEREKRLKYEAKDYSDPEKFPHPKYASLKDMEEVSFCFGFGFSLP